MFHANEDERFYLDWAVRCGYYSPSYFAVDDSFAAVWQRILHSLDVCYMGYNRYWETLGWLYNAGKYLLPHISLNCHCV